MLSGADRTCWVVCEKLSGEGIYPFRDRSDQEQTALCSALTHDWLGGTNMHSQTHNTQVNTVVPNAYILTNRRKLVDAKQIHRNMHKDIRKCACTRQLSAGCTRGNMGTSHTHTLFHLSSSSKKRLFSGQWEPIEAYFLCFSFPVSHTLSFSFLLTSFHFIYLYILTPTPQCENVSVAGRTHGQEKKRGKMGIYSCKFKDEQKNPATVYMLDFLPQASFVFIHRPPSRSKRGRER